MRRIVSAVAVPALVITLLVGGPAAASAADGGKALRHPPTCC